MKNLFSLLLIVSLNQFVSAQIEKPITKGNFITGGSFAFDFENSRNSESISFGRTAILTTSKKTFQTDFHLGYYVINHLALGISTDIITLLQKETLNIDPDFLVEGKNNNFGMGPFIRYSTNSGIFFEGTTSIGFTSQASMGSKFKWEEYSFSLGSGYSLFVSRLLSIEPSIKYNYIHIPSHYPETDDTTINGLTVALGIQVYFSILL